MLPWQSFFHITIFNPDVFWEASCMLLLKKYTTMYCTCMCWMLQIQNSQSCFLLNYFCACSRMVCVWLWCQKPPPPFSHIPSTTTEKVMLRGGRTFVYKKKSYVGLQWGGQNQLKAPRVSLPPGHEVIRESCPLWDEEADNSTQFPFIVAASASFSFFWANWNKDLFSIQESNNKEEARYTKHSLY